jgi:hypothetical protein
VYTPATASDKFALPPKGTKGPDIDSIIVSLLHHIIVCLLHFYRQVAVVEAERLLAPLTDPPTCP